LVEKEPELVYHTWRKPHHTFSFLDHQIFVVFLPLDKKDNAPGDYQNPFAGKTPVQKQSKQNRSRNRGILLFCLEKASLDSPPFSGI